MAFYPGPGLGGHCIPIDPLYLSWKAKIHGFEPRFIELSSQVNAAMPEYVVERIAHALNEKGKAVKGSHILILGVAYKRDVSDTRESPALEIIQHLRAGGAHVSFHDPFVPVLSLDSIRLRSVSINAPSVVSKADCVVIVTDHQKMDYPAVVKHARLIIDTRNALRYLHPRPQKLIRL